MPEPTPTSPSRRSRALAVARWVAVGLALALLAVMYAAPHLPEEPEVVAVKGEHETAVAELEDKLVPPSRSFSNPVARQLVQLGTDLVERPRDRQEAARQLYALTENPALLGDDLTAYLAVRSAYWQLRRDPEVRGSLEAALMLWDTADRLEAQGEISTAVSEPAPAR
jgi:hypothetical protein